MNTQYAKTLNEIVKTFANFEIYTNVGQIMGFETALLTHSEKNYSTYYGPTTYVAGTIEFSINDVVSIKSVTENNYEIYQITINTK